MGRFVDKLRACCICCGKRRYEKNDNHFDVTSEVNGIPNPAFEKERTIEKKTKTFEKVTNIIQRVDFIENMKDMERFDEIAKEFVELKSSIRFEASPASQMPQNRGKNRFMNILPNETSRVKLSGLGNDFINANRIVYQNGKSYIATQAPLPGTKEDFWFMVWQERVSLIVMLTNLVEGGKTKSDHYWPYDQQKEEACEGLTIEMSDETIQTHWSERTFYLSNDVETRKVKQIQLTSWHEGELPPDDAQFHHFIRHVKEEQTLLENSAGDEHPVIVHCSDGSLRSGLYIGIDQLIHALDKESYFDILGVAHKMKSSRHFCIQHETQYKFLYDFVRHSLSGKYDNMALNSTLPMGEVSEPFERLSSAELVEDETNETRKMAYFNPALDDDSSSDSSSSFTDTDDEETVKHNVPKDLTVPSSPVPTPSTPPPVAPAKVPSPLPAISSTTSAEPAKMTAMAAPMAFGSDSDSSSDSDDSF